MSIFIDQIGGKVVLGDPPQRIISLVPSITELLFDLGLQNKVVGITKFCIHPDAWCRMKTRVGGTKNVNTDLIASLHPDLIIANKEENVKEQIEQLQNFAPVWVSDVSNLEDAVKMIHQIGELTATSTKAKEIVETIEGNFRLLAGTSNMNRRTVCYLIWQHPYMTVGGDTFIHDMLQRCGFENVFAHSLRYPEVSVEQIATAGCDAILLSSEPYPFKQQHAEELQKIFTKSSIKLVDGEMFSWYGSRLIPAASYLQNLVKELI
ncbi:MAG TPA: helical backbone metal receptor [Parafilimonas sp.]|nr:helical backbone metal receptor [Parafilimonas sp.]